jgi:hypothetical protein
MTYKNYKVKVKLPLVCEFRSALQLKQAGNLTKVFLDLSHVTLNMRNKNDTTHKAHNLRFLRSLNELKANVPTSFACLPQTVSLSRTAFDLLEKGEVKLTLVYKKIYPKLQIGDEKLNNARTCTLNLSQKFRH